MKRVAELLIVGNALIVAHIEAAAVAKDAGADILLPILDDLGEPLGVGKEVAGEACAVELAVGNCLGCDVEGHPAGANNWDINEILDMLDILKVAVLGHIDGRMCPIPCVIGAVIAVEHIIARILQILGRYLGLLHVSADLDVILAGESALTEALGLGDYRISERNGEILAAFLLDSLDYLGCETISVLKGAAVFVGPLIDIFKGELVEQIALVDSVDLNAVHACVLEHLGGLSKCVYHLLNLSLGHLSRGELI